MMTVKEYALDINKDVKVVLEKCKELGFNAKNEDDMLSEDEVIDLDNQVYNEDEYNLEDKVEEIVSNMKNVKDTSVKVQKLKKKSDIISASDFKKEKKEMYKHKEKLMSNAPDKDENKIVYKEGMTLSMLANLLNDNPVNLIKKFMSLGVMLNMNSPVSFDDAELVVIDYNKELKKEETMDAANFEKLEITDDESLLETRPPVVTIMGHVDHGKTSLLDKIRESSIVSGEAGGITQHIGAYQVEKNGKKITFIDTPGHAAFTEMRARGAAITDIVIIIVAADDGVMPQTKEAIDHAKAAKVPIIVAINKIDKPTANVDKVMTEMTDAGLTPDSWGGDTTFIKISALTGEGIDELLETILLTAEMENLKANPNRYAMGSVIEAKLDKNVGSVVTLLIQNGTLRLGDNVVVGTTFGKVRTLKNDLGIEIASALPSTPVEITGLTELPSAGDKFMAFETEKQAKAIAETRKEKAKQKSNMAKESLSLDDLFSKIEGGKKEINVILKADVKGNVIRSATGAITESDVVLANASEAIIIGFNVRPSSKTKELAKEYNVDIRLHNIIYKVVEELESAMKGMLDPEYEEKVTGEIEVRKLFKFSKVGTIAGSHVTSGIVKSNSKARLIRDGVVIYDGAISSIQREKDTVKEVKQGFECGITLDNYNDIKEGDTIEAYEMVEIKR